jgi:hypothetical protein
MGERARERAVQRLDLGPSVERVGALLERLARPVSQQHDSAAPRPERPERPVRQPRSAST